MKQPRLKQYYRISSLTFLNIFDIPISSFNKESLQRITTIQSIIFKNKNYDPFDFSIISQDHFILNSQKQKTK